MNENLTLIGALVDRSGSMFPIAEDTAGGLATFIEEQKKAPGEANVTLAQFDNEYELVYPPTNIEDVSKYTLQPRGGTALLDAMGRFITDIGTELARQDEDERPGKVIILILTDGGENSSHDWSHENVKKLVTEQQDIYKWEFIFMGANIDAFSVASGFGIARGSTIQFDHNSDGTQSVFAAAANYATTTRSGIAAEFTDAERSAANKK